MKWLFITPHESSCSLGSHKGITVRQQLDQSRDALCSTRHLLTLVRESEIKYDSGSPATQPGRMGDKSQPKLTDNRSTTI